MSEYSKESVKNKDVQEHIEHTVDHHELSSIEDTDTWLIAITVSMGGFLFGITCNEITNSRAPLTMSRL
jgi:hypothetical protein